NSVSSFLGVLDSVRIGGSGYVHNKNHKRFSPYCLSAGESSSSVWAINKPKKSTSGRGKNITSGSHSYGC
ncbi:hypothetical protein OAE38_03385, partial [Akkermansiaceae bacterium]|nr:hypothetical protein [Akkermansiaceae bacterium]